MKKLFVLSVLTVLWAAPRASEATTSYYRAFTNRYALVSTRLNTCAVCHDENPGAAIPAGNPYGVALVNQIGAGNSITTALANIEPTDSDGDGFSNLAEITARTFPGDPNDHPVTSAPSIGVSPATLPFGNVRLGASTNLAVTVTNTGNAALSVTNLAVTGTAEFGLSNAPALPLSVPAGSSTQLNVRYTPTNIGSDTGTLTIGSNDSAHPTVTVALTGTGVTTAQTWVATALHAGMNARLYLLWTNTTSSSASLWALNSNAVLQAANAYGPYGGWSVTDLVVGRLDNAPHLVWSNTNGMISVWNLSTNVVLTSAQNYGPYSGWSYSTMAVSATNNDQWVLWKHTTGQVSLHRLNSNSVFQTAVNFGPYPGWSAEELAVGPEDGKLRLLWKHSDGTNSLWRLSTTGVLEATNNFGPYTGWTVQTLTQGPADQKVRLLWENTSGAISVWRLTTNDVFEAANTQGPIAGWLTLGMVMRPDNKLQLPWDHTSDHAFSLWRLGSNEVFEAASNFGPYTGWNVLDGDVDGNSRLHLLWRKDTGEVSLWRLSPTGTLENATNYGPY